MKATAQMIDVATPLTYWRSARSWRGAFEGWIPTTNAFKHVPKALRGVERFYMAGQWVEPGGGVPMAIMSGGQVVEIICTETDRTFTLPPRPPLAASASGA
jgi:phytoene dehydrogenase-like protein